MYSKISISVRNKNLSKKLLFFFPFFVGLYETTIYLSNDMYLPALPQIKEALNTSIENAQDTMTMWFLGAAAFQFIVGPLSDRFGRRPILFSGAFIFILGCFISTITKNIDTFLIARFMQGVGVPTCIVTSYALIHEYFSTKKAIQVLAWMGSIIVLGPAVGPLIGSVILSFSSWQTIFLILTIFSIIPVFALFKVMPESKHIGKGHPIIFKRILRNYITTFSNHKFMGYTLTFSINLFPPVAWVIVGPFLVIEKFSLSEVDFALIQIEVCGAYVISCFVVNKILERFNHIPLLKFGQSLCFTSACLGVLLSSIFESNLNVLTMTLVLFSIGNAFVLAISNRMAIESSSLPKGVVLSSFSTIISISTTLTSKFITEVYDYGIQEFCVLVLCAGIISSLLLFFTLKKRK